MRIKRQNLIFSCLMLNTDGSFAVGTVTNHKNKEMSFKLNFAKWIEITLR